MDYNLQLAKAMAKKEMNLMQDEEIKSLALKERKKQLISNILISICVMGMLICGIICFIVPVFSLGIFSMILTILIIIFLIRSILDDRKKTNKDLVLKRLERKYIKNPDLIDNNIISDHFANMNKYREIIIPSGLFSKNKILVNNDDKTISFDIGNFKTKEYKFDEIIRYELAENGESVVKGTAGKALVGGLFFGLGGAIVGSSMSRKVNNRCQQLNIMIYLNDMNRPYINVPILTVETDKSSSLYKNSVLLAQEICGVLEFAINQKTLQSYSDNSNKEKTTKEQLQELKEMLEEGLIAKEEYEAKKKQILGL